MSLYVDIDIVTDDTEQNIGKLFVTRKQTDLEGIHTYAVEYEDAEGQRVRSRLQHREADGAFVLASKAMAEMQRVMGIKPWQ